MATRKPKDDWLQLYRTTDGRASSASDNANRTDNLGEVDKGVDTIEYNRRAEIRFLQLLEERAPVTTTQLIADAAYELDISVVTAKRYLIKYTASRAQFVIQRGVVRRRHDKAN